MTTQKPQILIIKHGALGDIILATGAMKAIRAQHPDARITLLTAKPYDALMSACPFIDAILVDEKPKIWQWQKLKQLKALLQSQRWHWVYDLQTSQRTTCYFPLLKTQYYSGLSPKGSHPHLTPERTSLHTLDRLAQQLEIAGIAELPAPDVSWLDEDIEELFNRHCERSKAIRNDSPWIATSPSASRNDAYVLLVPGGAPHRPAKRWPHYAELAKRLIEKGYTPVLIGTKAEETILNDIETHCHPVIAASDAQDLVDSAQPLRGSQNDKRHVINLMGQTSFAQIAALARRAAYAVGNDTGPMHLIAAAGCPCTVIFNTNESNPEKSAPRGDRVRIEASENLAEIDIAQILSCVSSAKAELSP